MYIPRVRMKILGCLAAAQAVACAVLLVVLAVMSRETCFVNEAEGVRLGPAIDGSVVQSVNQSDR